MIAEPLNDYKTPRPLIFKDSKALKDFVHAERSRGHRIAFVPTMGALHDGHLTLVRQAQKVADIVIVSIFVNPAQFGPSEDYREYPRSFEQDCSKLDEVSAHAVFAPPAEAVYPQGFSTSITVGRLGSILEGRHRPGHFDGVATVVCKLFMMVMPDIAFFGEKDYQQLLVICQMVKDLDLDVQVIGVETVRDQNGLALSSRNDYLDEAEYIVASSLNTVLLDVAKDVREGKAHKAACEKGIRILTEKGFDAVDYLEVRSALTLEKAKTNDEPLRVLVAAKLGKTRLIDNVAV